MLEADPDAVALIRGDQRWSREQLWELSGRAVAKLRSLGAEPGDAVVAHYDTGAEEMAIALAASRLGCVFMPIPRRLGARELNYVVGLADPVLVAVQDRDHVGVVENPGRARVLTLADSLAPTGAEVDPYRWRPGEAALVGFTSGSTGHPKGVMHGVPAMEWVADLIVERGSLRPGEPICVTGAGAGAPGFTFYTYLGLTRGLPIVKSEKWDPKRVLELMARERCVWSTMVPTMLHMLMTAQRDSGRAYDLSAMRTVSMGGAPMSEEFISEARELMTFEPLRVYAMAECMMHSHSRADDPIEIRNGMDGRPGPGAEIATYDSEGRRLPTGETGEIGMRGPSLMLGYLGDAPGSLPLTSDGFFLSGDLGRVEDNGCIKVVGRLKDMIIRGGYNIDPGEVEELLRAHPEVRDVAIVGYPDPVYGERACAVLWTDGVVLGLSDIAEFLLERNLSKDKIPEMVVCRDELPQSPDGKILKGQLRAEIAALVATRSG
ncbi:putative acyl-CoA synthetase [Mycolicibacterium thermoresistibile ATCC 19527]|uniref:Putative acyl-CoA synthetase n=2 Tax=Mycolicibacterium thermoresistibile TaxID=1797 RepID=G7CB27_MYCT3|nr:putative acyl-CoA synthetase [Mycolicibacterium thermoresistibile ATCC 19527]